MIHHATINIVDLRHLVGVGGTLDLWRRVDSRPHEGYDHTAQMCLYLPPDHGPPELSVDLRDAVRARDFVKPPPALAVSVSARPVPGRVEHRPAPHSTFPHYNTNTVRVIYQGSSR